MNRKRKPNRAYKPRTTPKPQDPVAIILSYWPLYNPIANGYQPGTHLAQTTLTNIIATLNNDYGQAAACLWTANSQTDVLCPILIIDKAQETADHLIAWTENKPQDWFKIIIENDQDDPSRYAIILMPELRMSVDRYHTARRALYNEPRPEKMNYNILFRPITFGTSSSPVFPRIKTKIPEIGENISVTLLDTKHFNIDKFSTPNGLEGLDKKTITLGLFKRGDPKEINNYLKNYMKDMKAPAQQSWVNPDFIS